MAYYGYEPSKVAVSVGQGVITSVELGTDAVNTIDILNDAVTPAKIDDDGTGFQMGTLGLGGAVSGSEKLTVTGTASFSGAITGNLTGDVSGTSATVTGASQSAITSVGSLTGLTIDASDPILKLKSDGDGNANTGYVSWESDDGTSEGWLGYGSTSDSAFKLYLPSGNDHIEFLPNATSSLTLTSSSATFAGNIISSGTANYMGNGTADGEGILNLVNTSAGNETMALELINDSATAGTATAIGFQTYSASHTAKIVATLQSGASTDFNFHLHNGSNNNSRMKLTHDGNLEIAGAQFLIGGRHGFKSDANDWLYITDENSSTYVSNVSRLAGTEFYGSVRMYTPEIWSTAGSAKLLDLQDKIMETHGEIRLHDKDGDGQFGARISYDNSDNKLSIQANEVSGDDVEIFANDAVILKTGSGNALVCDGLNTYCYGNITSEGELWASSGIKTSVSSASKANGNYFDVFTVPNDPLKMILAHSTITGSDSPNNYNRVDLVFGANGTYKIVNLDDTSYMNAQMSGATYQVQQTSGGTQTISTRWLIIA